MQRLSTDITQAPMRTVRPVMLRSIYANPEKELVRLRRQGLVTRIAPGTYVAKPDTTDPTGWWTPDLNDAAMAYATAAYGDGIPVLCGIGAARHWHAIPRAIGSTVVAVPAQHRAVDLATGGRIIFTTRDVDAIDALPAQGELGTFRVASREQTLVDLLLRPRLGDMSAEAEAAARLLVDKVERDRLERVLRHLPHTTAQRVRQKIDAMEQAHG